MTSYTAPSVAANQAATKVFCVSAFARRNNLDDREEAVMLRLLGAYATEHELLMNTRRSPITR
jgi:hypothetical protein